MKSERLTYPLDTIDGIEYRDRRPGVVNKLGKLEDVEEIIGIDLLTLYRLSTQRGYWYLEFLGYDGDTGLGIYKPSQRGDAAFPIFVDLYRKQIAHGRDTYPFSEYGKTWALTEEELIEFWKTKLGCILHRNGKEKRLWQKQH